MMGVHVANAGNTELYFIVDPDTPRQTGALKYVTGGLSYVNFWGWVMANPEIQKLEQNEFQQMLWDDPLPQDEELWESVFFSRETPLSGIIDPAILVNLGGKAKSSTATDLRSSLAKQVMDKGRKND